MFDPTDNHQGSTFRQRIILTIIGGTFLVCAAAAGVNAIWQRVTGSMDENLIRTQVALEIMLTQLSVSANSNIVSITPSTGSQSIQIYQSPVPMRITATTSLPLSLVPMSPTNPAPSSYCDGVSHSIPPDPISAPTGCLLIVEWWVPPNPTPCGVIFVFDAPIIREGAIGTWWHVYPNRLESHLKEYQSKPNNANCIVEDLRG